MLFLVFILPFRYFMTIYIYIQIRRDRIHSLLPVERLPYRRTEEEEEEGENRRMTGNECGGMGGGGWSAGAGIQPNNIIRLSQNHGSLMAYLQSQGRTTKKGGRQ